MGNIHYTMNMQTKSIYLNADCYRHSNTLIHNTAKQPPYDQSCSSHINTEKASTQPVQQPQTYTTVVYQCYTLVVTQSTHPSDLVVLSYHRHHMHTKTAAFTQTEQLHAPSQATTGLETGRQHHTEWYCESRSPSVASNSEQRPLCTTWPGVVHP